MSIKSGEPSPDSMDTNTSKPKTSMTKTIKSEDMGVENMRSTIVARRKDSAANAAKKGTKEKAPKTKKCDADSEGRKLMELLDRALQCCTDDYGEMDDATIAECTALVSLPLKWH